MAQAPLGQPVDLPDHLPHLGGLLGIVDRDLHLSGAAATSRSSLMPDAKASGLARG